MSGASKLLSPLVEAFATEVAPKLAQKTVYETAQAAAAKQADDALKAAAKAAKKAPKQSTAPLVEPKEMSDIEANNWFREETGAQIRQQNEYEVVRAERDARTFTDGERELIQIQNEARPKHELIKPQKIETSPITEWDEYAAKATQIAEEVGYTPRNLNRNEPNSILAFNELVQQRLGKFMHKGKKEWALVPDFKSPDELKFPGQQEMGGNTTGKRALQSDLEMGREFNEDTKNASAGIPRHQTAGKEFEGGGKTGTNIHHNKGIAAYAWIFEGLSGKMSRQLVRDLAEKDGIKLADDIENLLIASTKTKGYGKKGNPHLSLHRNIEAKGFELKGDQSNFRRQLALAMEGMSLIQRRKIAKLYIEILHSGVEDEVTAMHRLINELGQNATPQLRLPLPDTNQKQSLSKPLSKDMQDFLQEIKL